MGYETIKIDPEFQEKYSTIKSLADGTLPVTVQNLQFIVDFLGKSIPNPPKIHLVKEQSLLHCGHNEVCAFNGEDDFGNHLPGKRVNNTFYGIIGSEEDVHLISPGWFNTGSLILPGFYRLTDNVQLNQYFSNYDDSITFENPIMLSLVRPISLNVLARNERQYMCFEGDTIQKRYFGFLNRIREYIGGENFTSRFEI